MKKITPKTKNKVKNNQKSKSNILLKIGGYFKSSWQELKKVQWPDRQATWSLTLAVIIFTGFFVGLIILLDAGFDKIFNLLIQ